MPGWLESLLELLGEKLLLPNLDRIRSWIIKFPLLVAIISIIPIFGPILAYGLVLDLAKALMLLFVDIFMLLALPIYPFYKLFTAIDVWVLTKRKKNGKVIGSFEWFWN
jgi:hypothetical protein